MAEKKTAEKKAATTTTKKEATVYVGPNRLTEGLKQYTVYRGDVSELVKGYSEKYKNISRLFVPAAELDAAMVAIKKQGTPLYLAFNEVKRGE